MHKPSHLEQRRKFLSDAFHTLNQPLTGLHGGLEITLLKRHGDHEYRQRISDSIENAGTILTLIGALRQLVEAADPGERFGTVSLSLLLSQLKNELEVVAEATRVTVQMNCASDTCVAADPGKLLSTLGALVAAEMERYEPGSTVNVSVSNGKKHHAIAVQGSGSRKPEAPEAKEAKVAEIRRNAAISYLWTLGGDFTITAAGPQLTRPLAIE